MEWYWITLIVFGVWIFCGFIAALLGYIFFHEEDEDKIKFWNIILIIILGLLSLLFVIGDINDKYSSPID